MVTEIECDPPYEPKNGVVQLRRATFGATVVFECDDGFELEGNRTLRCMQDGYWNGVEPKCKGSYQPCDAATCLTNLRSIFMPPHCITGLFKQF